MIKNIVKSQQFNREFLSELFSVAYEMEVIMKGGGSNMLTQDRKSVV